LFTPIITKTYEVINNMEKLIIRVKNKEKATALLKILSALDFVSSVEIMKEKTASAGKIEDFFLLAGLWENRDITAKSLRQEAWPERIK
jgi:hypothetical protein